MTKARPDVLHGKTKKVKTGCGNLYVTVNELDSRPLEVFCKLGKAGGCAASQVETVGRLISLALRAGVDVGLVVKQLTGIHCHKPAGFGDNKICSCSDGVSRVLKEWAKDGLTDAEWLEVRGEGTKGNTGA